MGGAGAHNYFLQSLVELGLVGLVLAALIAIPFLRLCRDNLSLVSFYALVGVAIGNLYGQSLLVREMLMLAAVFAGAYIWEAQRAGICSLASHQTQARCGIRQLFWSELHWLHLWKLHLALIECRSPMAGSASKHIASSKMAGPEERCESRFRRQQVLRG